MSSSGPIGTLREGPQGQGLLQFDILRALCSGFSGTLIIEKACDLGQRGVS